MSDTVERPEDFDIETFMGSRRLGPSQIVILLAIGLVMAVEGFDIFLAANIAPAIAKDFGLLGPQMAPILFFQQLGLAAGGMFLAPLADRFGRKTIIVFSLIGYALTTVAGTLCQTIDSLAVTRLATGLFLAGVLPNCVALATEYAPRRFKATFVTLAFVGFGLGSMAASLWGSQIAADHGWRAAFILGAVLPAITAMIAILVLPESVVFRAMRRADDPRILKLLKRVDPSLFMERSVNFVVHTANGGKGSVLSLFSTQQAGVTVVLWLAFVLAMINIGLTGYWMPIVLVQKLGISLPEAGQFGAIIAVASLVSNSVYGFVIDKVGARRVLAFSYVAGAVAHVAIGLLDWHSAGRIAFTVVIGLTTVAAQSGLNAVAAAVYPVDIRSTGTSWASAAGRVAGLSAPFIGAALVGSEMSFAMIVSAFGLPALLVAPLMFLLPPRADIRVATRATH